MTTAAQIIAAKLHEAGCRHAFGMPGGEVLLAMHEVGIEFSLCKHENNAGYMAEGSYHATGALGILLTTIGRAEAESFTHQVIDQGALMAPTTKAQFQVARSSAQQVIEKALMIARADPPGPAHVDVPHDIAGTDVEVIERALPADWPEGASLEAARDMLSRAQKPVILAGLGALHHGAGSAILALAEAGVIPVLTTYKAKGIMDGNHPLCLGGHGLSPLSDTIVLPLLRESDCIISAGYDPIEMQNGWIEPWNAATAIEILHADIQHGMHGAAVRFVGDVGLGIKALLPAVARKFGGAPEARAKLEKMFAPRKN